MKNLEDMLKEKNLKKSHFALQIGATSQQLCNWITRGDEIPKKFVLPISKELNISLKEALLLKPSLRNYSKANNEK